MQLYNSRCTLSTFTTFCNVNNTNTHLQQKSLLPQQQHTIYCYTFMTSKNLRLRLDDADAEWRHLAACRDSDPSLFFPVGRTGMAVEQVAAAKVVCKDCPAQADCLEFALTTNQDSGVWGGTSEEERRHLRRIRSQKTQKANKPQVHLVTS